MLDNDASIEYPVKKKHQVLVAHNVDWKPVRCFHIKRIRNVIHNLKDDVECL